MYGGYIQRVAQCFESAFQEIQAEYAFDYGDEFEIALCKALRRVLPTRYGVVRGHVVDEDDQTAGDDILIFEQTRFPTLGIRNDDYAVKEKIPIEAVYAYIEAKHTLNIQGDGGQSLVKAVGQAADVKRVCSSRKAAPIASIDGFTLGKAFQVDPPRGFPSTRNPIFAAVFARFVKDKKGGKQLQASDELLPLLRAAKPELELQSAPDLLVLGSNHVALPVVDENEERNSYCSPFFIPGSSSMTVVTREGLAFALGLASLMAALEWIRLSPMPWKRILAHAVGMREDPGSGQQQGG